MGNFKKVGGVVAVLALVFGLVGLVKATLSPGTVNLGTAASFAVLAGSGITSTNPPQVIVGDAGSDPTVSNGLTGPEVTGTNYTASDPAVIAAKVDLDTAYSFASTQITTSTIATDLAAASLSAGVYDSASGTFDITGGGTLTLNGGGNPDAVFIFKMATTLNTSGASTVTLINGAQACNVFWAVGSSATFGTTSNFMGSVLAVASITDAGGSTFLGRLLADADNDSTGAVTLDDSAVTVPACAPSLTLNKTVVNTGGGTAVDTDWTLTATGAGGTPTNLSGTDPVNSNVTYSAATFEADTYTLAESGGPADYTASTYSCSTNGGAAVVSNTITLGADDDAVCTITNTFVPPSGGGGGGGGGFFTPPSTPTPTPTPTPSATPTPTPTPAPLLPSTGIGPNDSSSAPWNLIIPTGIFVALLSFYLARKKQTV